MSFLNHTAPNYTRDRAETLFAQALQHIDSACIQEFLYPPQQTHLQLLQRTLMQPLCQALTMSVATITASDAPPLNELVHCVIFPSFTIGPLSVMYHIAQHVRSNISPYKSPYITRSVRDDEHGTYLVFAELDTGLTEVDVIIQHSPGVREQVSLVVKTAPFRIVMENMAKGRVYDARIMRDALVFTARINQIRPCPSCGRQSISCGCSLNLLRKRYPVDFATDLANLRSYSGDYEGLCCQAMYEDGVKLCTWTSRVVVTGVLSSDNNGTRKLESWAMWNTLQGRENLLKLAMPDVRNDAQPTEYVDEADWDAPDKIDRIAERVDVSAQRFTSHDIGTPSEVERAQYMAENVPSDELLTLETSSVRTVRENPPAPDDNIDEIAMSRDVLNQRFISHDIGAPSEVERAQYMAQNVPSDEVLTLGTSSVRAVPQNYPVPNDNIDGIAERAQYMAENVPSDEVPTFGTSSVRTVPQYYPVPNDNIDGIAERAQYMAENVPSDEVPTFGTSSVRAVPQNHPVPRDSTDGTADRADALAQRSIPHDTGATSEMERAQYVAQNVPPDDLPTLETRSVRMVPQNHPVPTDSIDGIVERGEALAQRFISHDIDAPSEVERAQYMAQNIPSDEVAALETSSVPMVREDHPVPCDNIDVIAETRVIPAQRVFSYHTGATSEVERAPYVAQNVPSDGLPKLGTSMVRVVPQHHSVRSHTTSTPVLYGTHLSTNRQPGISSLGEVSAGDVIDRRESVDRIERLEVPQLPDAVIASPTGAGQQPHRKVQGQTSTAVGKDGIVKRKRMGRPPAPPRRRVKQLAQILPTMSATDGGCEGGEDEETKPHLDAIQKLELRKAKNRASAVRSNERKKREIQALEDNLREAKGREEVLQRELEELTAENLALRGMLED